MAPFRLPWTERPSTIRRAFAAQLRGECQRRPMEGWDVAPAQSRHGRGGNAFPDALPLRRSFEARRIRGWPAEDAREGSYRSRARRSRGDGRIVSPGLRTGSPLNLPGISVFDVIAGLHANIGILLPTQGCAPGAGRADARPCCRRSDRSARTGRSPAREGRAVIVRTCRRLPGGRQRPRTARLGGDRLGLVSRGR